MLEDLLGARMREIWEEELGPQQGRGPVTLDPIAKIAREKANSGLKATLIRSFAAGALRTRASLSDLGYSIDSTCGLCGKVEDTIGHRLFDCEAVADARRAPSWQQARRSHR